MIEPTPYEKNTTFTKRPGLQQIISYCVFTLQTIIFYTIVLPSYNQTAHLILFTVLYSSSILILIFFTCRCSYVDPSDPIMIQFRNGNGNNENFVANKKEEGINLVFCTNCNSYVQQKSRHCRSCNRCAKKFDHHCKWINNCIGSRNYRSFIGMILTAFLNLAIYIVAVVILYLQNYFQNFQPQTIVCGVVGLINAIFAILIVNLLIFHAYLNVKGMSTVQFLANRAAEENAARANMQKPLTEANIIQKTQAENQTEKEKEKGNTQKLMVSNQQINVNPKLLFITPPTIIRELKS